MQKTWKASKWRQQANENKQTPTTETSRYSKGGKTVKHYALCRIAGRFAAVKDAYSSFFSQQCPINVHLLPDVAIVAGLQVIEARSELISKVCNKGNICVTQVVFNVSQLKLTLALA